MNNAVFNRPTLTVRVHAGLNAASILAGLFTVSGSGRFMTADEFLKARFPGVQGSLDIENTSVNGISGVTTLFDLPPEHAHRHPADIFAFYEKSALTPRARELAAAVWTVLAKAEARVHNATLDSVHFHEVGRMSNMLAVGLIAEIFASLNPAEFVASPLPLADGAVRCAHGLVPNPAPATLAMLEGVAVRSYEGTGETVTPTGVAILKGLGASFGRWPAMQVTRQVTSFAPHKIFKDAPNGLVFALGTSL